MHLQTHVGRAVEVKGGSEKEQLLQLSGNSSFSWDFRKSPITMYERVETEPCVWPAGFLEWAFSGPQPPTHPTVVKKTPVVMGMARQHLDDTILPWRFAYFTQDVCLQPLVRDFYESTEQLHLAC